MKFGLATNLSYHTNNFLVAKLVPLSIKINIKNWIFIQLNVLGYSKESMAYRLMKCENYDIFISHDVIFYEVPIKVTYSIIEEKDPNPLLDVNFFQINTTSPQTSTIATTITNRQLLTLNLV